MACLVASPLSGVNKMASKPKEEVYMEILNENAKKRADNLQEAFEKFRKGRQREMKAAKIMEERSMRRRQDVTRMEELRVKFLEGMKKYFGIPYAKRYHDENSPHISSPLFLDCCGLIRRVLLDLKEEFGFVVRGGNQAYMFDTLPDDIKQEEMKPGDLVFISATYYNIPGKKWKKQRHDMVHVEVWAGDGEKTIGARWQRGVVQVFDSYKFVSKSYYDMKFHFKSIDTWLMGICKSFCAEHSWRSSLYDPGKNSIFAEQDEEHCEAAEEQEGSSSEEQESRSKCLAVCKADDGNICEKSMIVEGGYDASKNSGKYADENESLEEKVRKNLQHCSLGSSTQTNCDDISEEKNTGTTLYDSSIQRTKNAPNNSKGDEIYVHSDTVNVSHGNIGEEDLDSVICLCPACHLVTHPNCIHTESQENNLAVERSPELTSSLECFEVIASPECRVEVEHAIAACPIEKVEQNGSNGGNTPSKKGVGRGKGSNGSPPSGGNKKGKDSPPKPIREGARSRMLCASRPPSYYVSPGNGSSMVESTLLSLGWRKLEDRYDETFKLKWVECKSQIDYKHFRERDQLVNHISNIGLLTTKLGLLCSLQEYERVLDKVGSRQRIQLSEFVPETLKLTNLTEKHKFVNEVYKEGEVWICKPIGQNQGKGIYMVNSSSQLREKLHLNDDHTASSNGRRSHLRRPAQGRIIQRYITNPLLLNNLKFDVRTYMFIASTNPYVVFYYPGYIRLSCEPYSPYSEEAGNSILLAHLTNQYIQKKHPMYSSMKEETIWSFERIQSYIDEHHTKDKELAENWMFTTFTRRMQQIMLTCFNSVRKKLHRKSGFFDLLGFDFMIDENFKVWLIEVNVNPSLNTNCQILKEVIPDMVDSTVRIALEIFDKTKIRRPLFPLENLGGFTLLYNGEGKPE